MIRTWTCALSLLALPSVASAASIIDDLINLQNRQGDFRRLSEDAGAALSYKPLSPTEPLGISGFDIGVEVTATSLQYPELWREASNDPDAPSTVPVAKLHAHKGLPFGIDVGLMYATVPDYDVELWGAELRYALVKGSVAVPAVGMRASYTQLRGVSQLDLETVGLDVSISKGFTLLTPYAGVGRVWVTSTPNGVPGLREEDFGLTKVFAGLNVNFGLINLAFEVDQTGDATSYGAKFGWRF